MKPITLVDLDDTLFRSRRKITGYDESQLTLGARVLDPDAPAGKHSYMNPVQKNMVDWLLQTSEVIPVTARGTESYANVQIPFNSYAIVANGAVILDPDGRPDTEWQEKVTQDLLPLAGYFEELLEGGKSRAAAAGVSIRCWLALEGGVATYVIFKENDGDGARLADIVPIVAEAGWVRHHNGNNLALIPPVISKGLATEFLLARLRADEPHRPVIGYGDSVSDFSYLRLCDWWGAPGVSQLTDLVANATASGH
jgi:hydroxymethylpyrimidine pyrophosphatase-like HAD family hydrolase